MPCIHDTDRVLAYEVQRPALNVRLVRGGHRDWAVDRKVGVEQRKEALLVTTTAARSTNERPEKLEKTISYSNRRALRTALAALMESLS